VINQTVNSIKLSDLLEEQRRGGIDSLQINGKSNQKGEKADGQNDLFGQCCHHGNKA